MNQKVIPYNKKQDLCSFNRQSEARNGSVLHPHIHVSRRTVKTIGVLKKTYRLIRILFTNFPHIICLTERQLRNSELGLYFYKLL